MGGSKSQSQSSSAPSSVWGAQSPYLEAMYADAFKRMGGQITPGQTTAGSKGRRTGPDQYTMGSVAPGGSAYDYAQGIAGGAGGAFGNQAQGGFNNQQMNQNLQALGSGQFQNQFLGQNVKQGLDQLGLHFQRNILPGINTGAAMTNTSGGSRQGVAQGVASGDAMTAGRNFLTDMYSQNFGQQLQSMLGANQQMGGIQQGANAAQQGAMQQAPQLAGLGTSPDAAYWQQQFAPLSAFQSIIGNPAILGGGSQSSSKRLGGGVFTGG